jgi:hypothetical protein
MAPSSAITSKVASIVLSERFLVGESCSFFLSHDDFPQLGQRRGSFFFAEKENPHSQ